MKLKDLKIFVSLILGLFLLAGSQEIYPQKPLTGYDSNNDPTKLSEPKLYTARNAFRFGENVLIRGEGFEPFEAVRMTVRQRDEKPAAFVKDGILMEWLVFADEKGRIATDWFAVFAGERFAAEAFGEVSKMPAAVEFIIMTHLANLDQCRNGTFDVPETCTGANWVNGDLNSSQAHYVEGESVPYRLILDNLTLGVHTVTIEYDSTESGKHAIDYLTSFDRTETTADPCSGIVGCNPAMGQTKAIPMDPEVAKGPDGTMGTTDDIAQVPGVFTLYGGTITQVSGYTLDGTFAGTSKTRLTVTFTAAVINPVLAWGGHISTRFDWGTDNSAIAISGAPFHMRIYDIDGEGGGNQDRSLQSGAVYYPGRITIIKDSQPDTTMAFGFALTGEMTGNFTLDDDGDNTNTYSNTELLDNLTFYGAGHTVTVTEDPPGGHFVLVGLTCTSEPNGGDGTNNNVISVADRRVEIVLEEGEYVTCTFLNTFVTAAPALLGGRVMTADGRAVYGARMLLTRTSTGATSAVRTNPFGNYSFRDLPTGEEYIVTVYAKGYLFNPDTRVVTLVDDLTGLNFVAEPLNE